MSRLIHKAYIIALSLLLTACGFSLRGAVDLPPQLQTLYLESRNGNSDIVRDMRRALETSGITLLEEPQPDTYRLGLGREQLSEEIISVNTNARAGEYELRLTLDYQLRSGEEYVIPPQTITLEQVYVADPNNAVAKSDEAEQIREEMRREMVQQILRHLQSLELNDSGEAIPA